MVSHLVVVRHDLSFYVRKNFRPLINGCVRLGELYSIRFRVDGNWLLCGIGDENSIHRPPAGYGYFYSCQLGFQGDYIRFENNRKFRGTDLADFVRSTIPADYIVTVLSRKRQLVRIHLDLAAYLGSDRQVSCQEQAY